MYGSKVRVQGQVWARACLCWSLSTLEGSDEICSFSYPSPECTVSHDFLFLCNHLTNTLDIRSEAKYRRLKAFAESAKVSGLAKKGRPGVLVFDGEKEAIRTFLSNARSKSGLFALCLLIIDLSGLRYLDFHHVDTIPLPQDPRRRIADARPGLREVKDMAELVQSLEDVSMKEWFRQNMGMAKGS